MIENLKLLNDKNVYSLELSLYLESINVTVSDNHASYRFFSLAIDTEPFFTSGDDIQVDRQELNTFDGNDSEIDEHEVTQFRTEWYRVIDTPLPTTYSVFSSEIDGIIKECKISQDISFNIKLPIWISNMARQFYNTHDQIGFEDFLLSVLRLRITIWATKDTNVESTEIYEVGEVVIKISENHLLSKNSFHFIHRIPDHDVIAIKEYKNYEEYTIGILRCFFNFKPLIIKNVKNLKDRNKFKRDEANTNCSLFNHVEKNTDLIPELQINKDKIDEIFHDFVPLQWEYLDDNNIIRGPYNSIVMMSWIIKGYFRQDSKLRLFEFSEECVNESITPRKYKNFNYLNQHLSLIKSDVFRIFQNSVVIGLNKETLIKGEMSDNYIMDSSEISGKLVNIEANINLTPTPHLNKRFEIENAVNMLKTKFTNIEKEFQNKFKRKAEENSKEVNSGFSSEGIYINKDEFIEFATKNVFKQKDNILFKKWCAEFGPDLVLEACAIRIQTAFRKYIRKKHMNKKWKFDIT